MPLTAKGEEILKNLEREYGKEKGKQVLYAGKNKGTFTGIDDAEQAVMDDAGAIAGIMDACKGIADACEGLHRRMDAYTGRRADAFAEQPAQDARKDGASPTLQGEIERATQTHQ